MPPAAETSGNRPNLGLMARGLVAAESALGAAALILPGGAAAHERPGADVEVALKAYRDAPTKSIDSLSSPTLVPGPNGLVSAEDSSLKETCIKSALSKPEVIDADITKPLKFPDGSTLRYIDIELGYDETFAGCRGYIGRSSRPTLLVSRPNNPKKKRKIGINMSAYTSDEAGTNENLTGTNDKGAIKCVKGRKKFDAILVITNKALNKQRKPIRVQKQRHRMRVQGRC